MSKFIMLLLGILGYYALSGCSKSDTPPLAKIEQGFKNVPDSVRIGCYWYWISDNISKEGVVKDLHAMKEAGITRAYIGNIDIGGNAYGNVKMFTAEWWEAVHATLKTATELDIEIGMFNSPGWSQSGGPWVKPAQSMRYLAATDMQVKGPQTLAYTVPGYSDTMQLVRVIAYPAQENVYKKESLWKTSSQLV